MTSKTLGRIPHNCQIILSDYVLYTTDKLKYVKWYVRGGENTMRYLLELNNTVSLHKFDVENLN